MEVLRMRILMSTTEAWLISLGITALIAIILFGVFYFTSGLRKKEGAKKSEHVIVDEAFVSGLLLALGGLSNIENVSVDNGRVKFLVSDLDLLITDELQKLSTSGVFITGKSVKLLFKYDSNTIMNAVIERGVKKC